VLVSDVPARLDKGAWENCNIKAVKDLIRDMVQYESHGDIQGDLGM